MIEYRLELPYHRPPLTSNQRHHWARKARITRNVRRNTATLAHAAHIPPMDHCEVCLVWTVTDRRKRDADNLAPTLKAACDGLIDAHIVADDTPELMTKHMPVITRGESQALTLIITRKGAINDHHN